MDTTHSTLSRFVSARRAMCTAVVALAAGHVAHAQAPPVALRFDGEYGLFVIRTADTLQVRWITRQSEPGWAGLASFRGQPEEEQTTPDGTEHSVEFRRAPRDTVLLRYGARDDLGDRHEIGLRPTEGVRRPPVSYDDVDSIFVMGDIHGELDTVKAVLRNAKVIDARDQWTAGGAHLVVVGDMVDRGSDATAVLWFLYSLEPGAAAAGGSLDVVLGNHELMVLLDDLRYTQPKELAIAASHGVSYDRMFDPRRTVLGTWLVSKPGVIKVNDVLFAHGGVSADYLGYSLESLDDSLATFTQEELFYRWADSMYATPPDTAGVQRRDDLFWGERSPFWYRAYVDSDTVATELRTVLEHFGARLHVVGHTALPTITERYDGAVVAVNTYPFAAELLLLVRTEMSYERWRFRSSGPPERIDRSGGLERRPAGR